MGTVTIESHCGSALGNIKVTDIDFGHVAILSESLDLVTALEAFSKEAKPLNLVVSWTKTKIQDFRGPVSGTCTCLWRGS